MTVQIQHTILPEENKGFSIRRYTGEAPFDISQYYKRPFISFSACWRGFVAIFKIQNNKLLLKDLRVFKETESPRIINGVKPKFVDFFDSKILSYENINLELDYTGRMQITKGYLQFGLRPKFNIASNENITELVFSSGVLQKQEDLSELIEQFREALYDHAKEEYKKGNLFKGIDIASLNSKEQEELETLNQSYGKSILEEKLIELPRNIIYPLFENFKLTDDDFKKEFNQRFYLNYGYSAYDW
ncbi:hypothetical protein U8527_20055 [Kordia algicida OT-1]|uniref:Uncharacterized protein n=1 Tax=Kordia algicida OT-1 TaxID=391587 RepID=A9DKB2_9FLAO|nr:hypothetical protein [Kordia algicida]EDP98291.1 hypothetical protein KAOT1_13777 [Kordia algicida OT-1]